MNSPRRFFLEATPIEGAPTLVAADREHALKVLRMKTGDRLLGLDGRGHGWELEIERATRRELELRALGPPRVEAAAGEPGSPLPWIEVWCPLPKKSRAEAMIGNLTQLGLSRFVPLVTERCEEQARSTSSGRQEKLERAAREALKQCGRLWMPRLEEPRELSSVEGIQGSAFLLDPRGGQRLSELVSARARAGGWTAEDPLILLAGPEGGFSPAECTRLEEQGAKPASTAPYVLRIETAVEAALAICAEVGMRSAQLE